MKTCYRTLLHAAADRPGHFPNGPDVVAYIVAAGADVNTAPDLAAWLRARAAKHGNELHTRKT
jgi:Ankyrin repeat